MKSPWNNFTKPPQFGDWRHKICQTCGRGILRSGNFDSTELLANLDRNAVQVEHSVYYYLIHDSGVESRFAKSLDEAPDVKMFFKIHPRFKIKTPIGSYNPDWAVFLEKDGEQKLYFVLETKGTTSLFDLRSPERLKIHCGKEHFNALADGIQISEEPVKDWKEFKVRIWALFTNMNFCKLFVLLFKNNGKFILYEV